MVKEKDINSIMKAAGMLKLLSNPKRLAVLCYLGEGELSVGELEVLVGLSQSALSQHLAKLREEGVVSTRREQQTIYYSLNSKEIAEVIAVLHKNYCR